MTTSIDLIALESGSLSTPDVTKLTTNSLVGTGVFDILMKVTKLHLIEEYDNDRITGQEYSTVYLGALLSVMDQSVKFLLSHQQEEKVAAEIALLRQKTVTELTQTDDDIPLGLGFNGDTNVEGLVAGQKLINASQNTLIISQIAQADSENDLVGQKIITELSQTGVDFTQAEAAGHGFNATLALAGILEKELDKADAEGRLMIQKLVTEVGQTSITKPVDLGEMSATTVIDGLMKAQVDLTASQKLKTDSEEILLAQKTITELAQTSDLLDITTNALNTSTTPAGTTEKQKDLFAAQTNGFARDAEQKLAKMMIDAWSVDATVGTASANSTNKLDDVSLGAVMAIAKTGIGA